MRNQGPMPRPGLGILRVGTRLQLCLGGGGALEFLSGRREYFHYRMISLVYPICLTGLWSVTGSRCIAPVDPNSCLKGGRSEVVEVKWMES
ncbi:hypothetical protein BDV32DRAFT_119260 [Aspergillus pseudonomiae]|uniref:Uncharacterized protein n=1 Tax=Aspergillus pseudonomiae TaxID=1506151 RepID=A0A5N6IE69_9EURO|nr:uncharacterized protein BDV37DRAFT_235356 [Aspergillus pseudonomiae]KAB8263363.1 hypothetical protein BDV32DRAFT_119260 [Aspergillus pseudonomiae]KAE8409903.1 hypothetical protein BDV37DRAFT_235356 [Aspergillus pseudonomiae]